MGAVVAIGHSQPETVGPQLLEQKNESEWAPYYGIELRLEAMVAVEGFTLGMMKALQVGSLVRTKIKRGGALPLEVNRAQIGWCELEGSGGKLAVRIEEWK